MIRFSLLLLPIVSAFFLADAQDSDSTKFREGLRDVLPAYSELMTVTSFVLRPMNPPPDQENFNAIFFVPKELANKALDIVFENNQRRYFMIPDQKRWRAGTHTISWGRSEIAAGINLGTVDLRGRAIPQNEETTLIPMKFNGNVDEGHFELILRSNQSSKVQCTIYDPSGIKVLPEPIVRRNRPARSEIPIIWEYNKECKKGVYIIEIEYWLYGTTPPRHEIDQYKFYIGE